MKNNVYPSKPQFYYKKVGFKGGQNYIGMFSLWNCLFRNDIYICRSILMSCEIYVETMPVVREI